MSRSREGTWLTGRSPMRTVPAEMSSSPATMRSAVVLPQPDGPTSTMNSLSTISRVRPFTAVVPSGYVFVTPSKFTAAIHEPPARCCGDPTNAVGLLAEALVQAVDQLRHRLEAVGDHAQTELAEVLRLPAEPLRERADDVVGRHRSVAVDEMVQIARREAGTRSQLAVR